MACFDDGSILILDKERDDQAFHPMEPQSWAEEHFHVTRPGKNGSKHNPVVHWRLSQQGITAFAFSPDKEYVATVGKDGLLRTVEYQTERLCDVFVGYYGRLLCVAWSPDGKYILTGGQDDLVTIWSFKESRIIARCQGHRSWVTGVAFDPLHCSGNDYKFASVGEDCKLLLWDFSVNALHKPKQEHHHQYEEQFLQQPSEATQHIQLPTIHPALSKCQVPFLRPIVKQTIHPDPCVDIIYKDDCIVTTDRRGRVRAWSRPQ
ncbi:WD40 repeat-like protein, partial [Backusella circina FSU 941]